MSSVTPSRSLQASALTFVILSIGHTVRLRLALVYEEGYGAGELPVYLYVQTKPG
jgi:hypothetical protein